MDDQIISNWLRQQLKKKGMTANEFAGLVATKMSRAAVYHYLSGKRIPSRPQLEKLCAGLGVDVSTAPSYEMRKQGQAGHKS